MKQTKPFPLALEAPSSAATPLTEAMLENTLSMARQSPRGRIIQRLHKKDDDPYHRMFNAMQPGSYFRAHRHLHPPKSETLVLLRGALRVVIFDDDGTITGHHDLRAGGEVFGIDLLPQVYHTIIILEPDTVMFESKTGPYTRSTDKDFPKWAPEENSPDSQPFLKQLQAKTNG